MLILIIGMIGALIYSQSRDNKSAKAASAAADEEILQAGGHIAKEITYSNHPARYRVLADDSLCLLRVYSGARLSQKTEIPFSDLAGFEAYKNGRTTAGIGKAIVGGVIAGGVGALIGASRGGKQKITSYTAVLYLKNLESPTYEFNFNVKDCDDSGITVKQADAFVHEMTGLVRAIVLQNGEPRDTE